MNKLINKTNIYIISFAITYIWILFFRNIVPTPVFNIVVAILVLWCSVVFLFGDLFIKKKQKKINYHNAIMYELVRDWETPITKFYKGHMNTSEVWAKVMGIEHHEFHEYLESGYFEKWFKIIL